MFTVASKRVYYRLKPDGVALIVVIYRTAQHTKVPGFEPRQLIMGLWFRANKYITIIIIII